MKSFKYYVTLFLFSFGSFAGTYQFPNTAIVINTNTALYTDPKTGGFIPADRSFQFLAFEYDMEQPNNLSIRAFEETWKKAGQQIDSKTPVFSQGYWGMDFKGHMKDKEGRTSYFRNYVIGDFLKIAQLGFVCAKLDSKEQCAGSEEIIKKFKWNYKSEQRLLGLKSKMKVPEDFKLYMRVKTKSGPVFMYTRFAQPMNEDKVPTLTFAVNKGKIEVKDFLNKFAKNIEMSGIKAETAKLKAKRTKKDFLYSWGKRTGQSQNFYVSCGNLDEKQNYFLMVCATGDDSNYTALHAALSKMATQ
ncbi:MAG: hypothetical protein VX642_16220 [Bdellovibrionota bacterium]|nr:hypothetical protein [Bdellovibrionota bacterium]